MIQIAFYSLSNNGEAIELREKGMGKCKNKSDPLKSDEEQL